MEVDSTHPLAPTTTHTETGLRFCTGWVIRSIGALAPALEPPRVSLDTNRDDS